MKNYKILTFLGILIIALVIINTKNTSNVYAGANIFINGWTTGTYDPWGSPNAGEPAYTNNASVTLLLTYAPHVQYVAISNDSNVVNKNSGSYNPSWQAVPMTTGSTGNSTTVSWTLPNSGSDGTKYVYCIYKKDNGNIVTWDGAGTPYQDDIYQDTGRPNMSSVEIKNADANGYDVYAYGVSDAGSGISTVKFPTWTAYNGQNDITWGIGTDQGGGTWKYHVYRSDHSNEYGFYYTHVYAYDNAGNSTGIATPGYTFYTNTPSGSFSINNGAAYATDPDVTLNVNASGNKQVSNPGFEQYSSPGGGVNGAPANGWNRYVTGSITTSIDRNTSYKHSGNQSQAIYVTGTSANNQFAVVFQDLQASPGKTYTLSAYAGTNLTGLMQLEFYTAGRGAWLATQSITFNSSNSDLNNIAQTVTATAPQGAVIVTVTLGVFANSGQTGNVLFDDVTLKEDPQMMVSNDPNFSGGHWEAYTSSANGWSGLWWKSDSGSYKGIDENAVPAMSAVYNTLDFTNYSIYGQTDYINGRFQGYITPAYNEAYTLYVTGDDGVRLWLDGTLVIDKWIDQGPTTYLYTTPVLTVGKKYKVEIEHYQGTGGQRLLLEWSSASQARQAIPASAVTNSANAWALSAGDGAKTVYIKFRDAVGNISLSSDTITLDTTAPTSPTIAFSAPAGYTAGTWTNQNVTFTITPGTDSGSGVQKTQYSLNNGTTWTDYSTGVTISTEGKNTILSKTIDKAGLASDSGINFNGTSSYIGVPNDTSFNLNNVTMEAWIYTSSYNYTGAQGIIVNKESSYELGIEKNTGKLQAAIQPNWAWYGTQVVPLNQWVHVAATWDGSVVRLYVNGNEESFDLTNGNITNTTNGLGIGARGLSTNGASGANTFFAGTIGEVRLWNYARTKSNIQTYMNGGITGSESGLVGYWKFYEGAGATAYDSTANVNDGTIYGATYNGGARTVSIDKTNPTGGVSINGGAGTTVSTSVTLTITGNDALSGVKDMMISNYSNFTTNGNVASPSSWETFAASNSWTLLSGGGTKNVYIKFRDAAGNISTSYNSSITFAIIPTLQTPAITNGVINLGEDSTLSATGTNISNAPNQPAYKIYYTNSPAAPAINNTMDPPGAGWTASSLLGNMIVNSSTNVSQTITAASFSGVDWTYVTFKVWVSSATGDGVYKYSQAYALGGDTAEISNGSATINYVGHNQLLKIPGGSGNTLVLSNPTTTVNQYGPYSSKDVNALPNFNTFIDGDIVKYRLEFDVLNSSGFQDLKVAFDFNLLNEEGIEFIPTSMKLEKLQGNTFVLIKDLGTSFVKEGRNRYIVAVGNDNLGNPMIQQNLDGRYAIEYTASIKVDSGLTAGVVAIRNNAQIMIFTDVGAFPDSIVSDGPSRKMDIDTKVYKLVVQYR